MPWIDALSEPQDMRSCIRDLVALSILPTIWKHYTPQQIADSFAPTLLSMLGVDVVYVSIPGLLNEAIQGDICIGLSLSICRTIVEAHGGRLKYERNTGRGAPFRVTLPAAAT
jgi:hypothetical protein